MADDHDTCIRAYRRIGKAEKEGRGVRLSADEVSAIWNYDNAVRTAVESEDVRLEEEQAPPPPPSPDTDTGMEI